MIKSNTLMFVFFVTLAPSFSAYGANSARVSLEDAKRFAIENNFEVRALRRRLEEVSAQSSRTNVPFFPKVGIAGGVDSQMTQKGNDAAPLGYLYGTYNVFSGFEDTYRSRAAGIETEKASIRLKQGELRVGLEVERQFHLHLFKKRSIEIKTQALELNEIHKGMARQRRGTGLGSEADVMEFDLRDALLRSDLAMLDQELEESRVNLRKLLGEEVGSGIEPVGSLQHRHLKGALADYIKRIPSESEIVTVASRDLAVAETESKIWRSRWLPRVELDVKAGYLPLDSRPQSGGVAVSGQLLAKFDLFTGFDALWERKEREAKRVRSEFELKQGLLNAASQVETAFRKIKAIESRVHFEEQNQHRAKRYYDAVLSEYRRGVKNSADIKVAAEMLFDSTLRWEGYKYEFLNQQVELERVLGGRVEAEVIAEQHEDH